MASCTATVYLIGAGPGDPGLLTLRGKECLERSDVVLYDYLASPRLLDWVNPEAERHCLGRHGQGKLWTQSEINRRMVDAALAGKTVARLKGGDPSVFGRLAEEVEALQAAGLAFEIVPGVTAGVAVGAYAGVTLTDRSHSSCVTFVTGYESRTKQEPSLDYAALASLSGTLVVYMGVTSAEHWSRQLIAHGKPSETPVVVVRRCSHPDQRMWRCTLGGLAETLVTEGVRPPALAIVGEVTQSDSLADWFSTRPLVGQTVLVTRPDHQALAMTDRLHELGAQPVRQPAIEIAPPESWSEVDSAIERLTEFDWLVFSSRNGVASFFDRLEAKGLDARAIGKIKLAAIGPATLASLAERRLRADLQPKEYRAEALADLLSEEALGKRFLLIRASRGREILSERLRAAGGMVDQVVAYRSLDVKSSSEEIVSDMAAGRIDWITVTSSAIARSVVAMFGDSLRRTRLAAISPLTASVLTEQGYPPEVVARVYTSEGLLEAIINASPKA